MSREQKEKILRGFKNWLTPFLLTAVLFFLHEHYEMVKEMRNNQEVMREDIASDCTVTKSEQIKSKCKTTKWNKYPHYRKTLVSTNGQQEYSLQSYYSCQGTLVIDSLHPSID